MRLQKQRGFTLVELLVVIVIIGSLIAISAPIIIRQLGKGKEARALQQMRDMETALFDYQEDNHGLYPRSTGYAPTLDDVFDTSQAQGIYLIEILRGASGVTAGGSPLDNKNSKKYLEIKETTEDAGYGVVAATGHLLDPWSRPYYLIFDGDADEEVIVDSFILPFNTELEDKRVSERIVSFSLGARKEIDAGVTSYPGAISTW